MRLTWLGHACFLVEQDGYTVLLDPYEGVEGYPPLWRTASRSGVPVVGTPGGTEQAAGPRIAVHKVLCSHGHHDHNAVELTELLPEALCPFAIRAVETFHDDQGGTLRGSSSVHILTAGGVSIAHLGDLGHRLTAEQAASIGPLDAALVPVGGYYTIDAQGAKAVCDALNPRCVIPMHYRRGPYGYPVLAEAEDFLALWPEGRVRQLDGPALTLGGGETGVLVPKFREED